VRTDRSGDASITLRFPQPGRIRISATASGYKPITISIRVLE
jgi:hypothetical protein